MIKKILLTMVTICILVGTISFSCLGYTSHGEGTIPVYNGSYWCEKAWVNFEADDEYNYWVKVWVKKNNVVDGFKRTAVYKSETEDCYSLTVAGTGGVCYWEQERNTGVGK